MWKPVLIRYWKDWEVGSGRDDGESSKRCQCARFRVLVQQGEGTGRLGAERVLGVHRYAALQARLAMDLCRNVRGLIF